MLTRHTKAKVLSLALLATTTLIGSGCGELTTGANLKPTVRYRPSTTESVAQPETTTETAATEAAVVEGSGNLKGKIEFTGAFTTLPPLYVKGGDVKDKDVCAAVEAPDETILVKDGGLANVFIYLKKAPKTVPPAPSTDLIFDQKYCVFKPHAMAMRVGQTVRVLNSDSIAHNTHTNAKKNTGINNLISPNDAVGLPLVYKQSEQDPFSVVCDIHPWMRAYHLPVDHPYFAVSGADGTFEIKDLPAGQHEFKVWHEAGGVLEKSLAVTIKPGDNELTVKVSPSQLSK